MSKKLENHIVDINKKVTAVEWLESEFIKLESTTGIYGIMYKLIDQAKEMEKEQHKMTYNAKLNRHYFDFEHFYNETFNK
jgi:hypothetical protein